MPALVFMLPKGSLRHPAEGDAPFICMWTCRAEFVFKGYRKIRLPGPRIVVVTILTESSPIELYHANIDQSPGQTIKDALNTIDSKFYFGDETLDATDEAILD